MTTSMDISLLYARAHALPDGLATDGELLDEVLNKLAEWEPANSAEDEKLAVEWVNVLDLVRTQQIIVEAQPIYPQTRLFQS